MTAPTEEAPSPSTENPAVTVDAQAPAADAQAPAADAQAPATDAAPASGAFLDFLDLDTPNPATSTSTSTPARKRSGWWRIGFPISLVLLFLAIPVLVYTGIHVVLDSNHGRLIASTSDPSEPGWEAAVEPTPTDVVATVNDDGQLSSVAVLAQATDSSGTVLLVPADTQIPNTPGYKTMVDAYATGGPTGLKTALEAVLNVDVGDVQVADAAKWEALVAPVGTLTVANPDSVQANDQNFPRGSIDLTPAQVAPFLRTRNYGEDDTNRLLRQEAFWRAWLAQVAAKGPDSVPGESDSGTGKFVRGLAGGQVNYEVLPVKVQARPDAFAGVFVPIADQVKQVVAQAVPFPAAAPAGSRPRLRVLDGTGQLDHGVGAAVSLAAAGGQVDGIGNASNFKVPTTQIIITSEDQRANAEVLQKALGAGDIVMSNDTSDSVDITIILGADAINLPAAQSGSGTGSGQTGVTGG